MITVFRDINLIDGTGAVARPNSTVIVENDKIREIASSPWRGAADIEIDGRGKSLLPGLMDMHVHLNIPMNPYETGKTDCERDERSVARSALHALDNSRDFIAHGVTTVRDVGSHGHGIFAVKHLIESGRAVGPRIYACGNAIAMTGGHCLFLGIAADGADGVRKQARIEMRAGAEILKFMASGAAAEAGESPYDIQLTEAEMRAGVVEAKGRKKTTAAHAVNPESIINAVRAGVDSIEHGVLLNEEALQVMLKHQTHLVPTIWVFQMLAAHGAHGTEQWVMEETKKRVRTHLEMVSRARELGIQVAVGTDSALPVNQAESVFWEIEWLMHCGYSNLEAIKAATLNGAELLEIDDRVGSIETGKNADILVVEGDPSRKIRDLRKTLLVLRNGVVVARDGGVVDPSHRLIVDPFNPPPGPVPDLREGV